MKKILSIILLILCITAHIHATKHKDKNQSVGNKTIILDLEGVLVEPNTSAALKEIGWGGMVAMGGSLGFRGLCRAATGQASTTEQMIETFFKSLQSIPYVDTANNPSNKLDQTTMSYKGFSAPPIIKQWLLQTETQCEVLKQHALQGIEKSESTDHEKRVASTFTNITFDPEKNSETLQVIEPTIKLLKKLKQHNNTLYVVAHWNREAFLSLKRKYPDIFKDIDEANIILSSETKEAKPSLYKTLSDRNVNVKKAFFIESDPLHVDAVSRPHSILCNGKNHKEIRTELQKFKALPSKGLKK